MWQPAPENGVDLWRRFLERVTLVLSLPVQILRRFCRYDNDNDVSI